jgi:hypothetical protein
VTSSKVVVRLPTSALATAGSVPLKVLNPPSSGGPSNALAFTVTSPAAVAKLATIDPTTAVAGATSALALNVTGSGFVASTHVQFNGSDVKTTYVSATSLTATVPTTMLKIPGRVSVTVHDTSGSVSTPQTFTITKPASACSYACADYGYSSGQCYLDWTCGGDGCLTQKACAAPGGSSCEYKCADYGYTSGQCYEDFACRSDGCLVSQICGGGGGGGGAGVCDYYCKDYGYAEGDCYAGWCCDTGCLVDESVYYGP